MNFPPEWHVLGREADLSAEQIAGGVTALGRANHAQTGYYTQAFFGLSIGLERLAKLIIVGDHAIEHEGKFPENQVLRNFGHELSGLLRACEPIARKYSRTDQSAARPNSTIHQGIVTTLDEFARLSRYYNLDFLGGGKAARQPEPVSAWWERVGVPILKKHYTDRMRQKDEINAKLMGALLGKYTSVLHYTEGEELIDTVESLSARAGATAVVQRYGRLYTLQIVRWLSSVLWGISHKGAYEKRIQALLGLEERFVLFGNDDSYLLGRKTWSIYKL